MKTSSRIACPCCGSLSLTDPGGFEICPVCCWEDDGQSDEDADVIRGGPNGCMSLTEARQKWRQRMAFEAGLASSPRKAQPQSREEE